MQDTSLSS